jgi:hypothetical protein
MKIYFEKIINEERERKNRVHYRWQAPENKLNIYSHRESRFKNSKISGSQRIEVEELKSKIEEVEVSRSPSLKQSKLYEVEDI